MIFSFDCLSTPKVVVQFGAGPVARKAAEQSPGIKELLNPECHRQPQVHASSQDFPLDPKSCKS